MQTLAANSILRGRMRAQSLLKAYFIAPFASTLVATIWASAGSWGLPGYLEFTFKFAGAALIFFYIAGAILLPFYLLYETLGWHGMRYYVPTTAVGGFIIAFWLEHQQPRPWRFWSISVGCAIAYGAAFALLLGSPGKGDARAAGDELH
jgi:hypothetical protein